MATLLSTLIIFAAAVLLFSRQDKIGEAPAGERLERIIQSPHYHDGKFHNLGDPLPVLAGFDKNSHFYDFLFKKTPRRSPTDALPAIKSDLKALPKDGNTLVWFGHSSYFLQIDGKRIVVDPVLNDHASPFPGMIKAFKGTNIYSPEDLPDIDYLFITHDHYDHLDYDTVLRLKDKTRKVVCGLGVGAHFEHWGFDPSRIIEKDWGESAELDDGFVVHVTPAQHFSGRSFKRNNTLWASYVLQTPTMKIFIGGDSGYGRQFAAIGDRFKVIDLAILECGQYNDAWRFIHAMPEEVLRAAKELHARRLFPVHSCKFALARHPWDEPLKRISKLCQEENFPLVTPMIGETVNLRDERHIFEAWWIGIN